MSCAADEALSDKRGIIRPSSNNSRAQLDKVVQSCITFFRSGSIRSSCSEQHVATITEQGYIVHTGLLRAVSSASLGALGEFDIRALANTTWAFAAMQFEDRPLLNAISTQVVSVISLKADSASEEHELDSLVFSILAIAWAFAFLPPFDADFRGFLSMWLLQLGRGMDSTFLCSPFKRVPSSVAQRAAMTHEIEKKGPEVLLACTGMLVVFKPPGWEVDTTAAETDACCLSGYLQQQFSFDDSPILHSQRNGFGFIHRLDVASSGLVLVGASFEAFYALQWQKNIYEIDREYFIVGHDMEAITLRDVDSRVSVRGLKNARTLTEDTGQLATSHFRSISHLRGGAAPDMCYSTVLIRIFTGRRHQIRAHTRSVGHPTATDGWYAPAAVRISSFGKDFLCPAPSRAWVRTPRWDGELCAPPDALEGQVHYLD